MRVAALALAGAVLAGCWDKKEGDTTGEALQERRGDSVAAPGVAGPNATDTTTSAGSTALPDSLRARPQSAAQQQGSGQRRRTP